MVVPSTRRPFLRALLPRERPVRARVYKVDFGRELAPRGALDARARDCRLFLRAVEPRQVGLAGHGNGSPASAWPPLAATKPPRRRGLLDPPIGGRSTVAAPRVPIRWISRPREQCFPFACVVNSLRIRTESSARYLLNHIQWRMSGERADENQSEFRAEGTSCPALSQHAGSSALPGALPAHPREVAPHWAGTALHQVRSAMLVSPGGSRRLGGSRNARVHIAESERQVPEQLGQAIREPLGFDRQRNTEASCSRAPGSGPAARCRDPAEETGAPALSGAVTDRPSYDLARLGTPKLTPKCLLSAY